MLEIPSDLDPALIPLAFLLGRWTGPGVGAGDLPFTQLLEIAVVPGRAVLSYVSSATAADGSVATDLGFLRPGAGLTDVELVLVTHGGVAEVSYGSVTGYRLDLGSDAVMRTETGADVRAVRRLYGRVEGDLAYATDHAGPDGVMRSYASARLSPA